MNIRQILVRLAFVAAFATACSGIGGSSTPGIQPATNGPSDEHTAEAIAVLERMSAFLGSRATLRFEASIQYDAVQESGQKIEFGSQRRVAMRRPDKARVDVLHRDGKRELITFDGKQLSGAMPEGGVYASIEFTGTVGEAFDHLVAEYDVTTPLSDLLQPDLAKDVARRVLSAEPVGTATIAGAPCDHVAFRGESLDFQLFVRQGDEPVPMRLVIDYRDEPGSPQFRAQLLEWELESELPDSLFRFAPAAGAQRVPFAEWLDLLLGPPLGAEERE